MQFELIISKFNYTLILYRYIFSLRYFVCSAPVCGAISSSCQAIFLNTRLFDRRNEFKWAVTSPVGQRRLLRFITPTTSSWAIYFPPDYIPRKNLNAQRGQQLFISRFKIPSRINYHAKRQHLISIWYSY